MSQLIDRTILIALGGNALSPREGEGTITEQFAHTRESLQVIMPFIREGCKVAITHGNGPQVGDELLRVEMAAERVPALPLGVCVAGTQGTIGYMIEQSLQNAILDEGIHRDVVSLITQVIVDENDPALQEATKFIGHQYEESQARRLADRFDWQIAEQEAGIWRRVVPSPHPLRINNARSIRHLVAAGSVVIASGGGGIPAYIMNNGHFEGVDAVIDKDLAAAVLGKDIGANELYILTDVPEVYLSFGTPDQKPLRRATAGEMTEYSHAEHFPPGSMGPKIEAAIRFLEMGGEKVVLTDISTVPQALTGQGGTTITRD